jgi:DNA-binding transcriptional regulator GbsR (MarR family)
MTNTSPFQEAELLLADAVGEVIEHWGFRKALGRVWTVLYLAGEPLPAAALAERLSMSVGSVSMSLTELQEWAVVRRVWRPGERREFFEAETDFWKMVSKVISERERFWVRGVRERMEQACSLLRSSSTEHSKGMLQRAKLLLSFAQLAEGVIDRFLASRLADFTRFGALDKGGRAVAERKQ